MKIKILRLLVIAFLSTSAFAQQDPQFTNYYFNGLYLNPARAGVDSKTQFTAFYRMQYLGYSGTFDAGGAPVSQVISASVPMKSIGGGLGLTVVNDQIGGGSTNRELQLAYSYQRSVGLSKLAIGVSGGMYNKALNGGVFRPRDPDDPIIPTQSVSEATFDMGAGVYLYNSSYTLGLSAKHLTEPTFGFNTATGVNTLKRHYYLTGSYLIGVSYTIDITPMFLVKTDLTNFSPEAGALVTYNNTYWLGTNFRLDDAVSFMAGGTFLKNSLRIGYAFDYVYSNAEAKAPASHEFFVSYALAPPRSGKKSIIRTPRYRF